jgi:hypothetical protein
MPKSKTLAPVEEIGRRIFVLRRQRIMLDTDLAVLYGVTTKRLNEQVKRNAERFPGDFMFRLTRAETEALNRSHFATSAQNTAIRDSSPTASLSMAPSWPPPS